MEDTKSSSVEQVGKQTETSDTAKADLHSYAEKKADSKKQQNHETPAQPEFDSATELKKLEDQIAEYHDQLMRGRAELENFKKRTEREVTQIRNYANEQFAVELLAIKDSLEMSLQVDTKGDTKKLRQGIELTLKLLQQTFEKFGVKEINPKDKIFNPEYHQAMMTQTDTTKPPNTILNVLQKGYLMNNRLLRPAMVCVSSQPETPKSQENPTPKKQSEKKTENPTKNEVKTNP